MRRPFDIIFCKAIVRSHTTSASEAASAWKDLGVNNTVTPRDVLGVLDVGVVTAGNIALTGVDGSNDVGAPSVIVTNISVPAFTTPVSAAGAQFVNLPQYRQYRHAATTVTTGPIIYGLYIIGMGASTPVTQAI